MTHSTPPSSAFGSSSLGIRGKNVRLFSPECCIECGPPVAAEALLGELDHLLGQVDRLAIGCNMGSTGVNHNSLYRS